MFRELLEQAAAAQINEDNEAFLPQIRPGELEICTLGHEEIRGLYRLYISTQLQMHELQQSWHRAFNASATTRMSFERQQDFELGWNNLQQKLSQLANMILLGLETEVRNVNCYYDPCLLRIRKGWRIVLIGISSANLVPHYNDPFGNEIESLYHHGCETCRHHHDGEQDPDELPD